MRNIATHARKWREAQTAQRAARQEQRVQMRTLEHKLKELIELVSAHNAWKQYDGTKDSFFALGPLRPGEVAAYEQVWLHVKKRAAQPFVRGYRWWIGYMEVWPRRRLQQPSVNSWVELTLARVDYHIAQLKPNP